MTSKGKKEVEENEFYPTDRRCIYSLLEERDLVKLPGGLWIEPCAGSGRIISAVNKLRDDIRWLVCELNPAFNPQLRELERPQDSILPYGDFVHREWVRAPIADVLIMNPPFSLTMQFVRAALLRARWVVCLQRQGWFSGMAGRGPWLEKYCPDEASLPFRPSFRPDGKTDSCEYSWFIWPPGAAKGRRVGRKFMLPMPLCGQLALL